MKRNKAEQVGDVVRMLLRQQGLEGPLNEYRLIQSWTDVLGKPIERYTRDLYIRGQTLYVRLSSSVLKNELVMQRSMLVQNLNAAVGAQVITDIRFV
jgi:predicted nucleic acid-binding Zn ribbon protein